MLFSTRRPTCDGSPLLLLLLPLLLLMCTVVVPVVISNGVHVFFTVNRAALGRPVAVEAEGRRFLAPVDLAEFVFITGTRDNGGTKQYRVTVLNWSQV